MGDVDELGIDLHFAFGAGLEPGDGQVFGRDEAVAEVRGEFLQEQVVVGMVESVGVAEVAGGVDADLFGVSGADDVGEGFPLVGLFVGVPSL